MAVHAALENQLILSEIFAKLEAGELANCRLVSTKWLDVSLRHWRSTATPRISQRRNNLYLVNRTPNRKPQQRLSSFLAEAEANIDVYGRMPFRKFLLKSIDFEKLQISNTFPRFMDLQATHITTLNIEACSFSNKEELRKTIFRSFPNLQDLTLLGVGFNKTTLLERFLNSRPAYVGLIALQEESVEGPRPTYGEHLKLRSLSISVSHRECQPCLPWIDLFSHFSSLTTLNMIREVDYIHELTDLLKSIKLLRKKYDDIEISLNKIEFQSRAKTLEIFLDKDFGEQVALLREVRLPLPSIFTFRTFGYMLPHVEAAKGLLELYGKSLRKIEGYAHNFETPSHLSFPYEVQLDNLEELEMTPQFATSMEFLQYTPSLKELKILYKHLRNPCYPQSQIVSLTRETEMLNVKLMDLTVFSLEYVVSNCDIRRLAEWLPNVEKLRMVLDNNQIGIVCESWASLTKIVVLGYMLTDKGVLGIKSDENPEEVKAAAADLMDEKVGPNITLLKNLQHFSCESVLLTSASIRHGFLKMPSLKVLQADFEAVPSADTSDTKAAMDALVRNGVQIICP